MTCPHDIARVLPRPGPLWGDGPLRAAQDTAGPWRASRGLALLRSPRAQAAALARAARGEAARWAALTLPERDAARQRLRRRLRHEGMTCAAMAEALGAAGEAATRVLGLAPRSSQWLAAAALLDQRLAEMATGEGKTLALALAAAAGALAGMPVHVVTANEYLAARDAERLAPMYADLGLRTASLSGLDEAGRCEAYALPVVYATAKTLAFDFLRDRVLPDDGAPPLMRGLCMALLDEADSILLDEAEVPLILSRHAPQPARRAFLWQALAIARRLAEGRHFTVDGALRAARLTADGDDEVVRLTAALGGPWRRPRYRREAMTLALTALHALRRDTHYVVRNGAVELLDDVTGRIATARVLSRGLHALVALKEGATAPDDTDTVAQITFQRFFQRYWRLSGLSGTLAEARRELHRTFGLRVVRVPLHARRRLVVHPPRLFDDDTARWPAVASRVASLVAGGRPVLVGTDGIAASQALSAVLERAGIAHHVLHALHHDAEAAIVARAGRHGRVTVATRMAGRGTDIELDDMARAAGGLHVLCCQDNPSARLDRQLAGRAARRGDPGSTETWVLRRLSEVGTDGSADTLTQWTTTALNRVAAHLAHVRHRNRQWLEEGRRAAAREELLRQDLAWERRLSFGPRPR